MMLYNNNNYKEYNIFINILLEIVFIMN